MLSSLPERGMPCPFCLGLAPAPRGVFAVVLALSHPSGNWTHCPASFSYAGGSVRVGIRKPLGMLGLGHDCGPSLMQAGDQVEGGAGPPA